VRGLAALDADAGVGSVNDSGEGDRQRDEDRHDQPREPLAGRHLD